MFAPLVALLAEGVDRNPLHSWSLTMARVALLAEGVDRNLDVLGQSTAHIVALLAEGVDRNIVVTDSAAVLPWSPSSRRAWIEIQ